MGHAEKIWLLLIGLTAAGAWLAESGQSSWGLSLVVAGLIGTKGHLVIDHYMEMRTANQRFRRLLHVFVVLVPVLVLLSHGFSDVLKRLTTIA
ncbi:MAG: cytochrome C oxidase subunit IV family protein [Rhodocyclaceae bacterium]|nr:cytochrome C oxidase subunit IV family protein [Rhodocyclaceae bacterium]MDZ4215301.1 cytochrome C oxidase subunit IV family protein [Rhodocyclaceae bacterium]